MNRLRIGAIVEGHGEVAAVPILLRRIWQEMLGGDFVEVLQPYRISRPRFVRNRDNELSKTVEFVARQLLAACPKFDGDLVLILLDTDNDLPCVIGPSVLAAAQQARSDVDIICVAAVTEYESWFVAAAESLSRYLRPDAVAQLPGPLARERIGKGWIKRSWRGTAYSEAIDQAQLTAAMDLGMCRAGSRSFDKLCRELEARRYR